MSSRELWRTLTFKDSRKKTNLQEERKTDQDKRQDKRCNLLQLSENFRRVINSEERKGN